MKEKSMEKDLREFIKLLMGLTPAEKREVRGVIIGLQMSRSNRSA